MKARYSFILFLGLFAIAVLTNCNGGDSNVPQQAIEDVPVDSIRAIAKDAYIYAFPMVESYRIQHAFFVDTAHPEFKLPYNRLKNISRASTPNDKTIQSPNTDTPYSMIGLDLRTEPQILAVPYMDDNHYFSIQVIDAYTHNAGYFGSRTTGTNQTIYMVTGPDWNEEVPYGISHVIRCETELAMAIYRTQVLGPDDLANVAKIQKRFIIRPLSQFSRANPPQPAPAIDFITPLNAEQVRTSIEVFNVLNFMLQFCPVHPSEQELMARFAKIGIGPGQRIDFSSLSNEVKSALKYGIEDAWNIDYASIQGQLDDRKIKSGECFGTREILNNNYLYRMAAAEMGIYGNTKEEAMCAKYTVDSNGTLLDATSNRYTLRIAPDQLPPVNAFWSLTMYALPSRLLKENPIDRYSLNSSMIDQFSRDADGGITFYLQRDNPGKALESNWLPAPKGEFETDLRLYWPKESALDGTWNEPVIELVN